MAGYTFIETMQALPHDDAVLIYLPNPAQNNTRLRPPLPRTDRCNKSPPWPIYIPPKILLLSASSTLSLWFKLSYPSVCVDAYFFALTVRRKQRSGGELSPSIEMEEQRDDEEEGEAGERERQRERQRERKAPRSPLIAHVCKCPTSFPSPPHLAELPLQSATS